MNSVRFKFKEIPSCDFFQNLSEYDEFSWVAQPKSDLVYIFGELENLSDETFYTTKDIKTDPVYLSMAETWATNSYCRRMKVGSLIVKNKSIISDGYNGSPTGFPNQCEDEDFVTLNYVLHAEANAITKLAKSTQSSEGSTMYVTVSPCFECSKLIIQSGIKRIVFGKVYRKPEPLSFLLQAGIEIVKLGKKI
jgi:dCMP deaminase